MRSACVALCLLALGCGYRFTGGEAPLPDGIRAVAVPVFGNRTAEPSLEAVFTQAMRVQADRAGVLGGAASPARIEGEILSVSSAPVLPAPSTPGSPTPIDSVGSFRVSATVRLRLVNDGKTVRTAVVSGQTQYLAAVQGDPLLTDANRATALRRLARQVARDGWAQLAGG